MIAVIDYGAGNVGSVKKALDFLEVKNKITCNPEDIARAERIVLPGVGSFGDAMKNLEKRGLINPIKESIKDGKPFLGICLGMQILFEKSDESPGVKGLSIFEGEVVKFKKGKVPQIGWNRINTDKTEFLGNGGFVYFVNSYYVIPKDISIVASNTDYGVVEFVSAIQKDNVLAVQFHPEKSGIYGLEILVRWSKC